jgi:hypothetical protein
MESEADGVAEFLRAKGDGEQEEKKSPSDYLVASASPNG